MSTERIFVAVVEIFVSTEHERVLAFGPSKLQNAVPRRCEIDERLLNDLCKEGEIGPTRPGVVPKAFRISWTVLSVEPVSRMQYRSTDPLTL